MHAAVLRYFSVVARAGSIRRASEELHVASSAISRQIQKIEDELGVQLFERLPNGLRLTPAGKTVLDHADRTLQDFAILKSHLGALRGMRTGNVGIATLDSLLVSFLPAQIAAYHQDFPQVDYHVRSTTHATIAMMVAEGSADIGITFNLPHPEDLSFISDVPMPLMAMVARDHPLASRESVSLTDCAQYNMFFQLDTAPIRSLIEMELSVLERTGRVLVKSNNLLMLKPMVKAGLGVAFYTPIGVADELAQGNIVGIPLSGTRLDSLRMGLLVPKRRRVSEAVEGMIERLAEGLRALSPASHREEG